ncbi:MAG: histidine kinase [Cyclobacteriaceae bacterium]
MKFATRNWNVKKELIQISLIFFLGGFIQELIFDPSDLKTLKSAISSIALNGCFWVALWKGSEYLVVIIQSAGFLWVEQPFKTFLVAFSSIIFFTVGIITLILSVYIIFVLGHTWPEFIDSLRWEYYLPPLIMTLMINTFMHGRAFLLEWKQAAVEVEKFKNESLKSQYESLKNQVNPHFLFNSLNALSSLVYDDQAKAVDFIRRLSKVYRYVLDNKDKELVSLEEEIAFLEDYTFLQKIRFEDNLQIQIEKTSTEGMVPPIAIQILMENAIKHNIVSENKPLTVKIKIDQDKCVVSNNVQEKLHKDSTGIGLSNLKSRYAYLSDQEVKVEKTEEAFTVTLPILKIESNK